MSMMDSLAQADVQAFEAIEKELNRQRTKLELIASENIVSRAVMEAQGSVLTNKYAEGYPGKRYYGGCEYVDIVEQLAIDRAKELFGAAWANVQPHSGAQANMAVFFALLSPGDTILGMNLTDGGHLTHGSPVNISGSYFKVIPYGVDKETERIDYAALEHLAEEHRPKMIIAGASAYACIIDFERIGAIAKKVGAYFMVDMAHIAGLVAAGEHPSPVPHADIVTTTTHKTLRGPRGGMILGRNEELGAKINKAVFPGIQGGPLMHVIAAKAVALGEALQPSFKEYGAQVVKNAAALADELMQRGYRIVSGGTDTHVMLVDLTSKKRRISSMRSISRRTAIPFRLSRAVRSSRAVSVSARPRSPRADSKRKICAKWRASLHMCWMRRQTRAAAPKRARASTSFAKNTRCMNKMPVLTYEF